MNIERKTLTDIIDSDFREFSMYTIEQRAIPSVIDGLKITQRKLLYAMLKEHGGKRVKLSDLGGISKYGYHHGETSAIGAAIGMAQSWNNNAPLFEGHGNFGSRLVQEAAAPRYIFASLSSAYKKFFIDEEVAPASPNEDNPEPAFYLPIIPWVLVNGINGIAVGFKTDILPRSVSDLVSATRSCLKNPKKFLADNAPIAPTFPDFKGDVVQTAPNQWKTTGKIEYVGKNYFRISELPIGSDREGYVEFLNTLIDKDLIRDYDDACSKDGFGFDIKVSLQQKLDIERDALKYFKLERTHTEILTTLGHDGKLKIFNGVAELIAYFVEYRLSKFADKIAFDINKIETELDELTHRVKFIELVIENKVDFKKSTKQQLLDFIAANVSANEYAKRFINIPLYECTNDEVKALKKRIVDKTEILNKLSKLTPNIMYADVLKGV